MFFSERDISIKGSLKQEEQSGLCLNVILIWKNLNMKSDKESFLLGNDCICLRLLSIVDDHIGRLRDLNGISIFLLACGRIEYKTIEAFDLICFIQ